MKFLITGICGFVGSTLARALRAAHPEWPIVGIDNFIRPGSETNRGPPTRPGLKVFPADIALPRALESRPAGAGLMAAAANPSVLAGLEGQTSSSELGEHIPSATFNVLDFSRRTA